MSLNICRPYHEEPTHALIIWKWETMIHGISLEMLPLKDLEPHQQCVQ